MYQVYTLINTLLSPMTSQVRILLHHCPVVCFFLRCWIERFGGFDLWKGAEKRNLINPERRAEGVGQRL